MVNVVELEPGDVIVVKVDVGHMPTKVARDYMTDIKADLHGVFGTEQRILMMAGKGTPTEFTIVKRPR